MQELFSLKKRRCAGEIIFKEFNGLIRDLNIRGREGQNFRSKTLNKQSERSASDSFLLTTECLRTLRITSPENPDIG